jgi:hypothetical protein
MLMFADTHGGAERSLGQLKGSIKSMRKGPALINPPPRRSKLQEDRYI